ncbi:MAG: hypothetical protein K2X87_01195 [Gemmataceae bacterium]|nr:hypothetical protein [Gemmataceae bacterium]
MRRLVFGPAVLAGCALAAVAQQPPPPGLPSPRVNHAFPAGAKAGTTADVTVAGFDLDEPTGLLFSHPGITGEYLPPKEAPPDPKKKDAPPPKKRAPTDPQQFKVTVKPDVPPGTYDLRLVGKWGVSNPRAFVVGDRPEVNEKEPNNDVPEAQRVEPGTTVNGVIANSTDVDYAVFPAKKGQRVVLACLASSVDSPARPVVEVFEPSGRKLAAARGSRDADAVADFVAPADGDYLCRVSAVAYQSGGADHVYRLTIGTGPWLDGVFPPAVEPGMPTEVTLYGRNLPGGQPSPFALDGRPLEQATVTVTPPADAAAKLVVRDRIEPATALQDGFEYRVTGSGGASNPVTIYLAREKPVLKAGSGGAKPDAAQAVTAPCEVQGLLHRRGGRDWYRFDGKKGEPVVVELAGERIGSPADFVFTVHGGAAPFAMTGGEQDDDPDTLHPTSFYTKSADPAPFRYVPQADGPFLVAVGCRESSFLVGPPTAYRLRVGPPKPDFRAVVVPYGKGYQTGSAGHPAGSEAFEVYVHRTDGFAGPVTVTAKDLPAGVTAKPVVIGPAVRWGTLVLSIGPDAAPSTGAFTATASAKINGADVTREVRPGVVVWGVQPGQNVPVSARLTQSLVLAVRPEKAAFALSADPAAATIKSGGKDEKPSGPLVVKPGDKIAVPVKVAWAGDKQPVVLAAEPMLQNPQQAPVTAQPTQQPTKDKPEGVVTLDVKTNAAPGPYTVVIRGDAQVPFARDPMAKGKANVPMSAFADPIPLTVLPAALAKLTLGPIPNANLKPGAAVEVPVKVERLHDFAGEFIVTFVPAKDVTGIAAEPVTIPAGKDSARLVVKTAEDAKPGQVAANIVVTATYDGKYPIATETKAGFTVVK